MIYSDIALDAVLVAVLLDLFILKSQMITRGIFWITYALILPFQLLTNWWLTSKNIVMYSSDQIFGFSMIVLSLALWEFFSKRAQSQQAKKIDL